MAWTTTELLADIRRRARLSTTDPDHTDANLLLDADGQMDELLVPLVVGANSEYYVRSEDQALVANQAAYPIPGRCVASVPRQVYIIGADGQPSDPLPHLTLSERYAFASSGTPVAYAVQDDQIVLLPAPSSAGDTLRILYEYQPGKLVLPAACALTTDYDAVTYTFTCSSVPTTWTGATRLDIVMGTSPFSLLNDNLDPTTVVTGASGTVDFTPADGISDRIAEGASGHYLCPTGFTCLPMIPADLHSVLALAVAVEVLDQVGDPLAQPMRGKLELAVRRAGGKLQPRVKGAPPKIVSKNSFLRRKGGRRWPGIALR